MKVYYKFYDLTPKREFNRLDNNSSRRGVHLKIDLRRDKSFADFFSHPSLGDMHWEEFLERFKFQEDEMSQKTFHFLLNDAKIRFEALNNITSFKNHTLWHQEASLEGNVYKYKLKAADDFNFLPLLERKKKVRVDANGVFKENEFPNFLKKIDPKLLAQIEYVEDPYQGDWKLSTPVQLASDFIANPDYQIKIYKPNREFLPKGLRPNIFSSYMGSQLGQWHTYSELMTSGDLSLYHGVHIENFYQQDIFNQTAVDTFMPDKPKVKALYDELMSSEWKVLCSI